MGLAPIAPTPQAIAVLHRLDLRAIERSLRALKRALPTVSHALANIQPPLEETSVAAMLAGYAEIDRLARRHVDLFARGQSARILALNRLVLYGEPKPAGHHHHRALEIGERHFYESRGGGIGDLVDWRDRHRTLPPSRLAAGLYARLQNAPQLFVEGNHRTGALLVSHVLLRHGLPPFVVTPESAAEWFALTPELQRFPRHGPAMLFHGRGLQRRIAALIRRQADPRHLVAAPTRREISADGPW